MANDPVDLDFTPITTPVVDYRAALIELRQLLNAGTLEDAESCAGTKIDVARLARIRAILDGLPA